MLELLNQLDGFSSTEEIKVGLLHICNSLNFSFFTFFSFQESYLNQFCYYFYFSFLFTLLIWQIYLTRQN
jgi:hypothetical protein